MTVGFGISAGLLEVAVTVSVCVSFEAPVPMPVRLTVCWPESSLIAAGFGIAAIVGGSFTATIVRLIVAIGEVPPYASLAV